MNRSAWRGLALVCAVLVSACQSDEAKVSSQLEKASTYSEQGLHKEALIELRAALQLEPENAGINFRIAQTLEALERPTDAAFYYNETFRLDPSQTDAALEVASLIQVSETERAREIVAEVIEREPQNARAHSIRAMLELVEVDTQAALTSALTATQLAPEDPEVFLRLGQVHQARIREQQYTRDGQPADDSMYATAERAFDRAASLGRAQGDEGVAKRAAVERVRVLSAWPGHGEQTKQAFRTLADELAEAGDEPGEIGALRLATRYGESTGDFEFAAWALGRLTAKPEIDIASWSRLAEVERQLGRSAEAVFERLLDAQPTHAGAHVAYASHLAETGRTAEAVDHLAAVSDDVDELAPVLAFRARALWALERGDEARDLIARLEREFPDRPETALAQAHLALRERRPADAIAIMKTSLETAPSAQGHHTMASAQFMAGDHQAALAAIEQALEATPTPRPLDLRLAGEIHLRLENWPAVLQTHRRLVATRTTLVTRDELRRITALYRLGRRQAARRLLAPMFERKVAPVQTALLYTAHEGGSEPERALERLEAALEARPGHPRVLRAIAQIELRLGRTDQALERLDRLAESGRMSPPLRVIRARLLAERGELEEAEREALAAFQAAPDYSEAMQVLVGLYRKQQKLAAAIASFEQADEVGALSAPGRVLLARLYLSEGREAVALEQLEAAVAENRALSGAKNDLAFLLAKRGGDLERALELAREASQAQPNDPSVADTLGYVYLKRGLGDAAVSQLRHAASLADDRSADHPGIHYHLGLALREVGRHDEAVDAFEAALALDPAFAEAEALRAALEASRAAARASEPS